MSGIEIRRVTAAIGAEIRGVDLRKPLDASDRAAIGAALREHLAVFFRDQPLCPEELMAFGRQFGELEIHAFAPTHPDHEEVVVIDQVHPVGEGTACWHADATFSKQPPAFGVLLPAQLPALGGDTCFASAVAAFEALSTPLRELLLGLTAVHDLTLQLRLSIGRERVDYDLAERQAQFPPVAHPVVSRIPPAAAGHCM